MSLGIYSLRTTTDLELTYYSTRENVMIYSKDGEGIFFTPRGLANCVVVSRLSCLGDYTHAMLALGIDEVGSYVNVNEFHIAYDHPNEGLLLNTAAKIVVTLKGKMELCKGGSQVKGLKKVIPSSTIIQVGRKLGRVFIYPGCPKSVP